MFDEMGLDIHYVECRQIQKLNLVYHKRYLIQAKILSDDLWAMRTWHKEISHWKYSQRFYKIFPR